MTRWNEKQLQDYQSKLKEWKDPYLEKKPDEGAESVLQGKIVEWCKDEGYPYVSFKQSRRARGFLQPGITDLIIALPKKRTLWIELKDKKGRLSDEQKEFALKLLQLKHEWYEVRSFKRFKEIVGFK